MLYNDGMEIHLEPEIFEQVKNGTKNVEARVNDEKRRRLKVGETIQIINRANEQDIIWAQVTNLCYFNDFTELANNYPIERLYSPDYTVEEYLDLFPQFYTEDEIAKYGVVAIEFAPATIVANPLKAYPNDPDVIRVKKSLTFWNIVSILLLAFIAIMVAASFLPRLLK